MRRSLRRCTTPAVRLFEAEQYAHQRRLAGAVGTDERHDLALVDVEIDVDEQVAAVRGKCLVRAH